MRRRRRKTQKAKLLAGALLAGVVIWSSRPAFVNANDPITMVEPFPDSFALEETVPDAVEPTEGVAEKDAVTAFPPGETWDDMGAYKLTWYCPCRRCSGKWGHQTSSGATCVEGVTVACGTLPAGTVVMIDGIGERVVQDTGAGVRGKHLDIFLEDHSECNRNGVQYRNVWVKR